MNKLHIKVRNCRTCFKSKKTNKMHISTDKRLFFAINLVSALLMAVCNKKGVHKRRPEPQTYTSLVEVNSGGCFYNSHTTPQPYGQHRKPPFLQA